MTHKTHISELAENIIEHVADYSGASQEAYDEAMQSATRLLRPVFDALEAAEAKLTAMRRSAVPVVLVDERQGSGGFCLTPHGVSLKLKHGTKLFTHPEPVVDAGIVRDANRYRFLRDSDAWGEDSDSWDPDARTGLISSANLITLETGSFDAAVDSRMAASDIQFFDPVEPVVVLPVRTEHAAWSEATFGNVGPIGSLKHLSKEAIEAAEAPGELSEWADMQFLFWDAQRRAGITDAQIEQAMIEKLAINKARTWPEPKDGEPRMHVKSVARGS